MSEFRTLTARCHCRNIHFDLTIPVSSLPLNVHLCHCRVCRYTHGALCSFHAPIPSAIEPEFIAPSGFDQLTSYKHTNAKSTRYFCSTCGCQIGDQNDIGVWHISVSIFDENADQRFWEITAHSYTHSTRDGGLSALLPKMDEREIEVRNPDSEFDINSTLEHGHEDEKKKKKKDDELLAQCHCGGISMKISRPRKEYISSPASRGWIHPSDKTRWLALIDACSDCRLLTGTHVIGWLFVDVNHITPAIPDDFLIGTSRFYQSSEGVIRTFCGVCGATVFYSHVSRKGNVDIATGILRAKEGVMLEDWAVWRTSRLGYPDDGIKYDEAFTNALMEGLEDWGRRKHGEVRDFVVGSETHDN